RGAVSRGVLLWPGRPSVCPRPVVRTAGRGFLRSLAPGNWISDCSMNDQKNTFIAIALSAVLLLGWQDFVGMPQMQKQEQIKQDQQKAQQAPVQAPAGSAGSQQAAAPPSAPGAPSAGAPPAGAPQAPGVP